jgi:protein-disulfide isomerase
MQRKNLLLIIASVVVLIGILSVLYLMRGFTVSSRTITESCPTPSLVYVYVTEQQKNAADAITSAFKTVLNQYGINIINTPVCTLPASSLPQKLRIYPALLYKGEIQSLQKYTVGKIGDYNILAPTISATFAYYQGVNTTYGVTAEALIVESDAPYAKVNLTDKDLKTLLSEVAVANITKVTRLKPDEAGVKVPYAPTILFKSDYNLSQGVRYIVRLKNNIYTVTNETQRALASYLGLTILETRVPPDPLLDKGINFGSPSAITLYILEDYHCPFCADFITNLGGYLQSLVREGKIRLVFIDLIIHPEVTSMHAFTRCVYNLTGDSEVYFNITRELYKKGISTTINDTKLIALKYLPQQLVQKALECSNTTENLVLQDSQQLTSLGFTGTPTLIFWNNTTQKGLIIEGCLQQHPCMTEEQLNNILQWLGK